MARRTHLILAVSLVLALIAFLVLYFVYFRGS